MNNKQIAAIVWKSFGKPIIYACFGAITMYFFVMGPTTIGWFILGKFTYQAAHFIFYWGSALLAFLIGFTIMVKVAANWPDN
jgi:hypothetical protein